MPVYRDKKRGSFVFEFDRIVSGQRVRVTKHLPKAWNQAQADAFDRQESARLYATVHGIGASTATIEDAVAIYITSRVPSLKNGHDVKLSLASVFWAYQGRPLEALADVCKAIVLKSKKENGEPLAPATIKNRISYLRAACRWAWKHHNVGDRDPGARVVVPTVRNERHVYIDRAQMLKLCKACDHRPTRALIRIAFYSGMRLGEIERAEIVGGNFMLADTKNGDRRIIPIHPRLNSSLAYPKQSRFKTHHYYAAARALVGMEWLHFHDLRHSAASELINNGVDLFTVGEVLGHRSSASTKRYSHLSNDKRKEAIFKIGKRA